MTNKGEQKITNPKRIQWLLNSLKSQHQLIVLSLDKTHLTDRSIIIDVCSEESFFSLDVSVDSTFHKKMATGHHFSFDASLNGVDVRAEAVQASGTIDDAGGMLYKIPIPSELYYKQRRDSFRASLPGFFDVNVAVQISDTNADNPLVLENCKLTDISADGCQLSIPEEKAEQLTDLTQAVTLQLQLPDSEETLALSAMPRHSRHLNRSSRWLIGFELLDTPANSQDVINRFVTTIQLLARQQSLVCD